MNTNERRKLLKNLHRTMDRTGWLPKGHHVKAIDLTINDRSAWKAAIDAATVNGKVGVVVSGRDCDGCSYYRERVRPAPSSVVAWLREYEHHFQWLDGPETTTFVRPDLVEDGLSESRDLALEAFEDGHPHVVYY